MALQVDNLKGETVYDPYNYKRRFFNNREKTLNKLSPENRLIVEQYVDDMHAGRNVNGAKGPRGYAHLNTLIHRMISLASIMTERYGKTLITVTASELHDLFGAMRNGSIISKHTKRRYKSTHDYVKIFRAFWHWYMKIKRIEYSNFSEEKMATLNPRDYILDDITKDLSAVPDHKPEFVYFTFESLKKMIDEAKFKYRVLMLFLFDTGIRSPTELLNVKRKDISPLPNSDKYELRIRDETSKTFGRKIKLMLCSTLLKEYLDKMDIRKEDFVFSFKPLRANEYLKRISERVFGKGLAKLSENNSKKTLSLYDFRHSAACYWVLRYKNESALKYRFGWKNSDMIHYYTEFLGMKDTIQEDDLYVDVTKTELENSLTKLKNEFNVLSEGMSAMQDQREKDFEAFKRFFKLARNIPEKDFDRFESLFEGLHNATVRKKEDSA